MSLTRSNDEDRPSDVRYFALALALVVLVGVLDYLTGTEIGFSIFYLLPIALGTWRMGLRAGAVLSVVSALVWFLDDAVLGSRAYSHALVPVWNAFMRCVVFLLISTMLARLQKTLALNRRALQDLSVAYADLDRTRKEQLELKDQLLSHVSHELRTPLTAIHQFITIPLDGLAGGELNAEQRECLQTALRNVDQLGRLIGDLLDSARLDSGRLVVELRPMSLVDAVRDTVLSLSLSAEKKRVRMHERCKSDLPQVLGDPGRIRQVLYNLVDNAIKFTPPRGSVTVEASVPAATPTCVQVTVTDTGKGISESARQNLFQRLFQEARDGDSGRYGLGLGLFISREIVHRHGGKIWVENTPGRGSRFAFTVPMAETVTGPTRDADPAIEEVST